MNENYNFLAILRNKIFFKLLSLLCLVKEVHLTLLSANFLENRWSIMKKIANVFFARKKLQKSLSSWMPLLTKR